MTSVLVGEVYPSLTTLLPGFPGTLVPDAVPALVGAFDDPHCPPATTIASHRRPSHFSSLTRIADQVPPSGIFPPLARLQGWDQTRFR